MAQTSGVISLYLPASLSPIIVPFPLLSLSLPPSRGPNLMERSPSVISLSCLSLPLPL